MAGRKQYAAWGPIAFDLFEPEALEGNQTYDYAKHEIIEGKPRLHWIGDGLDELTLGLAWSASWCDPDAKLAELQKAAAEHKAHRFVLTNGKSPGRYVITEIGRRIEHTFADGTGWELRTMVKFEEYSLRPDEQAQAGRPAVVGGYQSPNGVTQ